MIEFLNWLDGVLWGLPLIVLMILPVFISQSVPDSFSSGALAGF